MLMFEDKWKPLFAAGDEGAGGSAEITDSGDGAPPPASNETPDEGGVGSGRSQLRKQLEKNFDADRRVREKDDVKDRKVAPRSPKRVAGGAEIEEAPTPVGGTEAAPQENEPDEVAKEVAPAPEAFSKEAKAEWAKTPPTVQQAILKREQDVLKGVQELKGRYSDIDKSLEPHIDAIRRHGHTPAQAVSQLFGWFQALAGNPEQAFPALAKSFNYDIAKIAAAAGQQQDGKAPVQGQPGGEIPPAVQKYINDMHQEVAGLKQAMTEKIGGLESTFQQQSEAKTQEVLMNWAKDKPHFESVRGLMAQLISSGAVPLKNGQVDLDGAYDMAIYSNPDVRTKLLSEQEAARQKAAKEKADKERQAQQVQADKARRAGVNISGGAPGASGPIAGRPGKKGKSVRESLADAMEEIQK